MKKTFLFLFVSFILINVINAQKIGPKIVPAETEFKFGDLAEGVTVTHNFVIFNKGDEVLVIKNVRASCGCTAVQPEKTELAPNESTIIKAEFNTIGRSGLQNKAIYVSSNDPQTPELRLTFTANILEKEKGNKEYLFDRPILQLGTTQHNFGKVKEGEIVEFSLPFQNVGKKELEIKDIQESCSCTVTDLSNRKLKPGEAGSIRIKLDTKDREGKLSRTVTFVTNDPVNPKQTITLFVNIVK